MAEDKDMDFNFGDFDFAAFGADDTSEEKKEETPAIPEPVSIPKAEPEPAKEEKKAEESQPADDEMDFSMEDLDSMIQDTPAASAAEEKAPEPVAEEKKEETPEPAAEEEEKPKKKHRTRRTKKEIEEAMAAEAAEKAEAETPEPQQEETPTEEEDEDKPQAEKKESAPAGEKEKINDDNTVTTTVTVNPSNSIKDMVKSLKIIEAPNDDFLESKKQIEDKLAEIIIQAGMNRANIEVMIQKVAEAYNLINSNLTEVQSIYENLTNKEDGLLPKVRNEGAVSCHHYNDKCKASESVKASANGFYALTHYVAPDGAKWDLLQVVHTIRYAYNFYQNSLSILTKKDFLLKAQMNMLVAKL